MLDSKGNQIVTGDIVKIENAYFAKNNAYWIVVYSPGDESWYGNYHSLVKVSKRGKVSYAKYNLSSWPLMHFVTSDKIAREAKEHDKQYARIYVVGHIEITGRDEFEKSNPNRTEYINWSER